jgi:hypothetical protein
VPYVTLDGLKVYYEQEGNGDPPLVLRAKPGGSNAPDRLIALKPDIEIGVTVGAGHFHQLEAPEQVTAMIEKFIQIVIRTSV